MKRVLFLLFATMLAGQVWAYDFKIGNLEYTITDASNKYVSVGVYPSKYVGNLEIPATVTNKKTGIKYTVTGISNYGFYNNEELTSVTIPNTVTSIPDEVFKNCIGLVSVYIPESVVSIGHGAFSGCSSLSQITIPESTTNIDINAFRNCSSLASINFPIGITNIAEGVFYGCSSLTSLSIPESITSIGASAFENCTGLTTVIIPNSVTTIYYTAFNGCLNIETLTYNTNAIGYCFNNKENLQNLTIGDSVSCIGDGAFANCISLTTVIIPDSVTSIGARAFSGCSGLTSFVIPNSVKSIGEKAFNNCSGLISITIGDSVTSIGAKAFNGCNNLKSIIIPNSVKSIGDEIFKGCSSLESITLPFVGDKPHMPSDDYQYPLGYIFGTQSYDGGIKTLQHYISYVTEFYSYYYIPSKLKEVIISGTNYIQYGAFNNCSGLTSITIPKSVTSIGKNAFLNCSGLTSITTDCEVIGSANLYFTKDGIRYKVLNKDSVEVVANSYSGDVVIPARVTAGNTFVVSSIGQNAFSNSSSLTSVIIPNTVSNIGNGAFYNCSGLEKVYCEAESKPNSWNFYPPNVVWGYSAICGINHTEITDAAVAATCTESGLTEGKHCSVCGKTLVAQNVVPASHTEIIDVAVAATCTATGLTEGKHCSVCGEVLVAQTEIPMTAHTIVTDAAVAATATKTGLTAGSHCSVCGAVIVAQEVVPALGEQGGENTNPSTAVAELAADNLQVYAHHNTIIVENATDEIRVYNAMGALVGRDVACRVRAELQVNGAGVYIVKVGTVAKRVMIND